MSKTRRKFWETVKAATVVRHLASKVPVSELADEFRVQLTRVHLVGQAIA